MQITHSLKAPGFNPEAHQVKNCFQAFAFKSNLYRYTADGGGPERRALVACNVAACRLLSAAAEGASSVAAAAAADAARWHMVGRFPTLTPPEP
jgi:hypothetical protein